MEGYTPTWAAGTGIFIYICHKFEVNIPAPVAHLGPTIDLATTKLLKFVASSQGLQAKLVGITFKHR